MLFSVGRVEDLPPLNQKASQRKVRSCCFGTCFLGASTEAVCALKKSPGGVLGGRPAGLRADRGIVIFVAAQSVRAFHMAPLHFREDRDLMMAAVSVTSAAYKFGTREVKADAGCILVALSYASTELVPVTC